MPSNFESGTRKTIDLSVKAEKITSDVLRSAMQEFLSGKPFFTDDEITTQSYEYYPDLDSLGRCGACIACISLDMMPTTEREGIGMVKPSGWHLDKYDFVDGKYLFNRCHLIGYQLTGENANLRNLITGTRYMNIQGMLPFENKTAGYIRSTGNHVMYRITPVFDGDNLVATGVLMEAYSVEDNGQGYSPCKRCNPSYLLYLLRLKIRADYGIIGNVGNVQDHSYK